MKIILTGTLSALSDAKLTAVVDSQRRTKEGTATETFYLKFRTDELYEEFKGHYAIGDGVLAQGLLRQVQTPILDKATRKALSGATGLELRNTLLAVEVREHRPTILAETDWLMAHGLVGIVDKKPLKQTASGLAYLQARVAFNHYKREGESQPQADFYNLVVYGPTAESLDNLEKGDRFVIDMAVPSNNPYPLKDTTFADGAPVVRNSPEFTLRDFSFLPRGHREAPAFGESELESLPF